MISNSMNESLKSASLIRKMFEEGSRLKKIYGDDNVYDFSIGNPDLEPPEAVIEAFRQISFSDEQGIHKYMNNAGYVSTRKAVADTLNTETGPALTADDIVMTAGAAGAINVALKSIIDPGDEVVVITPFFVEYFAYIRNHGGIPVIAGCTEEDYGIDLSSLESVITAKTKAVIINTPNNPSGAVYSVEELKKLNSFLKSLDHTVYVISDEPYREIVFGDTKVPDTMEHIDDLIMCYSWSKALALPGDRIGYLAVSPKAEDHDDLVTACITANRSLGFVNAPAVMQRVIEKAISAKVDTESYSRRCDLLYEVITRAGYVCYRPKGALYLFPESPIKDDRVFAGIAAQFNLLVVPGSAFGKSGHFRITFCVSEKTIINSYEAFRKARQSALGAEQESV